MIMPKNDVNDMAVKPQSGGVCVPIDGPYSTGGPSLAVETALPHTRMAKAYVTSNRDDVDVSTSVEQPTQHHAQSGVALQKPIHLNDSSAIPDFRSSYASYEGRDQSSQAQQAANDDNQVLDDSHFVHRSITLPLNTDPRLRSIVKADTRHRTKHSCDQVSSSVSKSKLGLVDSPSFCPGDVRERSRAAHGRCSPQGVTKTQRKTRTVQNAYSRASTTPEDSAARSGLTVLDMALKSIRDACLTEEHRMQKQMTSTVKVLEEEKTQLQNVITKHSVTIAKLRVKIERSDDQFAQLSGKISTSQKYVAGLQKDHEKFVVTQKQSEQALRTQVAEVVSEKALLQVEFESAMNSIIKHRKQMMETMNEIYAHYVKSLSRIKDLERQLKEQTSNHGEEKSRRIELENQLLPSLQGLQRQMVEDSAAIVDKVSRFSADLENRMILNGNNCSAEECVQILRKLDSLPLLTTNDVQRAESMLRFVHEQLVFLVNFKSRLTDEQGKYGI